MLPCIESTPNGEHIAAAERIDPDNAFGRRRGGGFEAAGDPTFFWPNGSTLRVFFLDGEQSLRERVMAAAGAWTEHANLRFRVVDSADAEIRVTFQGAENSSALGVTALDQRDYAPGAPTMILAEVPWATPGRVDRLARHEFGHAIGLVHEHSSPAAGIRWNKPVVYQALAGPPNYWKPEVVDSNVFHRYAAGATQFTSFDPDSVMIYGFPPSWTLDGLTYPENSELSAMDKKFARRIYP